MADNTDWFEDVQAVLDGDAAEPAGDSAPLLDTTPSADEPIAADAPLEEVTAETATEPVAQVAEPIAEIVQNWDSPDNPHYEKAQRLEKVQYLAQQLQQQQADKLRREQESERLRALSDDDPQRQTEIQNFIAQTQQPLIQRMQSVEQEIELAAKLATVYDEAVKLVIPQDQQAKVRAEVERMMSLPGGPEYLQRDIQTRQAERAGYQTELQQAQSRIAELERGTTVAAQVSDRMARGADLVDSGGGGVRSLETRWDDASSFDEAWGVIADLLPKTG